MTTELRRLEGPDKVTGRARYAGEHAIDAPLYLCTVQSTVARAVVTDVDTTAAEAVPGVVRVLTAQNAPRLADTSDPGLAVLQSPEVHYRGEYVAAVLAESVEAAREAAEAVTVTYATKAATTVFDADSPELYAPAISNFYPTDMVTGDADQALAGAAVTVRETYTTPAQHHSAMEPHTTIATWDDETLTVYESTQGVTESQAVFAQLFGLDPNAVTVIARHVGGGFGAKSSRHPGAALAALAARTVPGRTVKFALTRHEVFETTGYRPPTVQRVALGATADGRLEAVVHELVVASARTREYVEPAAVYSRNLYAAPHRRTTHRVVPMDIEGATWMRGPGETSGSFAAETAMDELACRLDIDPVELRLRNEPDVHPQYGLPWSSRSLVACLHTGAERFGWPDRDPRPRARLRDGWWYGTGVAAAFFPAIRMPGSRATVRYRGDDDRYEVRIGATDIGQGARTVVTQIAAEALGVPPGRVAVEIGDTSLPRATGAAGSSGTASWGTAVVNAAELFRAKWGEDPDDGADAEGVTEDHPHLADRAMGAHGAQFAEVAVSADTGEVRVQRMLGVFAAGRVINRRTARSQLLGAMTWGLSMALHEEGVRDPRTGHWVTHDLAGYHIATAADVGELEVAFVDEEDPYVNPMGAKGLGELGTVGAAAAIGNAAHHATGVRVRSLPITADAFLDG